MELKLIIESVLFAAQKPLSTRELRDVLSTAVEYSEEAKPFKRLKDEEILKLLGELENDHRQAARSYRLVCVAGSWQFVSVPEYAPWLKALVGAKVRPPRLSQPGLETLAIVAYRQPLTRAEIEQIRGVSVDGVMQTLLERGLVEAVGRAEVVGRPMTYATTPLFLEYFGLRNLEELPAADELRRIVVQKPEALLTVEPGLATPPPEQLQSRETNGAPTPAEPEPKPASGEMIAGSPAEATGPSQSAQSTKSALEPSA